VQAIELPPERLEELRAFLTKDPVQNLYALGVLEDHGLCTAAAAEGKVSCCGLVENGKLMGALVVGGKGGLVIPCVFDPGAATELGRFLAGRLRPRSVIGERQAVDALVRAAGCGPPRWSRPQRLFAASADDLGPFVCPGLRRARPADVPSLVQMSASAIKESMGEDPLAAGPALLTRRVEARVTAGRTFVLADGPRLLVKVDIGARSRHGAEFEGVYTFPAERRRGHATLALGQLSRMLLSSIPRVTMRVDEKDTGLAAVCRKVGFTAMRPQRLVVIG
jgi:hypothetical protein